MQEAVALMGRRELDVGAWGSGITSFGYGEDHIQEQNVLRGWGI